MKPIKSIKMKMISTSNLAPNGDRKCCVPIALATLTGKDFETINQWLLKNKYRKGNRSGTSLALALIENGDALGMSKTLIAFHGMTVNAFAKFQLPGYYLIRVSKHALCYKNGIVYDNLDSTIRFIKNIYKFDPQKLTLFC